MKNQNNLAIAAIQMVSGLDPQKNLDHAAALIKQAALGGAKLVVLPEFFIRISDVRDDEFNKLIEPLGFGKIQTQLAKIARKNAVYLVAGTIPIQAEQSKKCHNTVIVYDPEGNMLCHYHKIHLFKFDNGQHKFNEGSTFKSGKDVITFKIDDFSFGLTVCYDLRFPELFRRMAGVDAIIIPAAFLHHTGVDHWEILLRARAIENQCYLIASGQGGVHENGRHTFGHSMLVDPWGRVVSKLNNGEGIVTGNIDKELIQQVRLQLPALEHRKL